MDAQTIPVLFIGRNPDNVALIRLLLAPNGGAHFQIHHARDIESAEKAMQSHSPEVVLLDLEAPDDEALSKLSATIEVAADSPIIAVIGPGITPPALQSIHTAVGDYFSTARLNRADLAASILRQSQRARRKDKESHSDNGRAIRVLIVEDNPGDAALILRALRSVKAREFQVSQVSRLSSALECIHRSLDVVLLDLNLPDSHDLETLHQLRAREPHLPIIVVTGIEDRRKAVEALANGAQDYLVKGHADGHLLERAILRCVANR
jgi:DNA-binding NtrC family response regulator